MLAEGPDRYAPDILTDRPVRYLVAEYIREQVIRTTFREILICRCGDTRRVFRAFNGNGHKGYYHCRKGRSACHSHRAQRTTNSRNRHSIRQRIERLIQKKVHLELFVRTKKQWRDSRFDLRNFGYGDQELGQPDAPPGSHERGST